MAPISRNSQNCPISPLDPISSQWDRGPSASSAASVSSQSPSISKVLDLGGFLKRTARNPLFDTYEKVQNIGPNEAWFQLNRSPSNPTQFELAIIQPPKGKMIIVLDYSIKVFGFSPINPGDFEELPNNQLSGCLGYSVQIDNRSPGQLTYALDPLPPQVQQQAAQSRSKNFTPFNKVNSADSFTIAASQQYGSAAGYGTSLSPQDSRHYGADGAPFTEFIDETSTMKFVGVVYRPIQSPIAFIQIRVSGYEASKQVVSKLRQELTDAQQ